jgi:DNA-binding MarR family transcriptional regulator
MEKKNNGAIALFLREKPVRLLLSLSTTDKKAKYVSTLSRDINCTYSHTVRLLNEFERLGLVKFMKVSRVKYVELTEEGKDLVLQLEGVVRKLSKIKFGKEEK